MKIGFIGLGNVGFKLANSLLSARHHLYVYDLEKSNAEDLMQSGAQWTDSPKELLSLSDIAITCLPSPEAVANVVEGSDGLIYGAKEGKVWIEMSTTDSREMLRLGDLMEKKEFIVAKHLFQADVTELLQEILQS